MAASVVVDTGPIVALLDAGERNHRLVLAEIERLRPPLVTCEAVLTEATFLLARVGLDASLPARLVERGMLTVAQLFDSEALVIANLMQRYASVPMSLADACLVRLIERTPSATLFTLDADFKIYRQHRRRLIPLLLR